MSKTKMSPKDMERRLINFSAKIFLITEKLKSSEANRVMRLQLLRSSSSSALNYGEVQGSESLKDFIHKMRIILKELRETMISLKIIKITNPKMDSQELDDAIDECDELIAITVSSVKTAEFRLSGQEKE